MYIKITRYQRSVIYLQWLRGMTLDQLGLQYHVRKSTIWYIINKIITGKYKEDVDYVKLSEIPITDIM